MGNGAGMIFVTVCVKNPMDGEIVAFLKIAEIRDDIVYTEHIIGREHDAGIDDEGIGAHLEDRHIFADFTQSTQGDNA